MQSPEYRCKVCRKNLYVPAGVTGRLEVHCPRCGKRQDVEVRPSPTR